MTNPDRPNRDIAMDYFARMQSGDPSIGELFCDDIVWLAPQSSPVGRRHEGKTAVLTLMGTGTDLYDLTQPMDVHLEAAAAEGDRVFVELTLSATTQSGEAYTNHYVFVFRFRDGLISEIHEHLDTLYTQKKLFDPLGKASPLDAEGGESR